MSTTHRRRWFRFSLRTMFVVLTLIGVWLGYQVHWIHERREALGNHLAEFQAGPFQDWRPATTKAPGLLWLLGENGIESFSPRNPDADEALRLQKLFPEALVIPVYVGVCD